ncbi:MAG: polyribonucleotide nucleotidyltransferase, partial [Acidobacteria bacterium]|nr:polyribonucleotide nucleotidyltransferase [Acidobacteriota bacterium]
MSQKKYLRESIKLGGRELVVETGKVAKQADGAVVITFGDTMVLATAVSAHTAKEGLDFFPLTVEYRESAFSAGRIPGNYFRREGRPNEKEVLTARMIDRPVRPLFADGYRFETQIVGSVISADADNDPDVVAMTGASCALYLSDIPFTTPIAGIRIGLIEGKYVVNPTYDQRRESELNLIVSGTEEAIVMVESEAKEVSEDIMVEALMLAHKEIKRLCLWQKELGKALGIEKRTYEPPPIDAMVLNNIESNYGDRLRAALNTTGQDKLSSYAAVDALKKEVVDSYPEDAPEQRLLAGKAYSHLKEKIFREDMLGNRRRPDGRKFSEIRPVTCEVGWLPRVHGSSLFTRGETQAIVSTTLGTKMDEQYMDDLEKGEVKRRFLLHY